MINKEQTDTITIYASRELNNWFIETAKEMQCSRSQLIAWAMQEYKNKIDAQPAERAHRHRIEGKGWL
ncbi:MAG: hypothetical protein KIH63_004665 [Candidatus Saccharibacteria bacterium]|nr:hypothetical protein [Candidatus Saccharibacteria bacterium]